MAYCNIQQSKLGNKLDRTFHAQNRNMLANILDTQEFNEWFGNGKRDDEGNPFLDETLSFINESKEKKNVFDFAPITFQSTAEVYRTVKSSPAIHLYRGELFINNTKKDTSGAYSAKNAVKLINTINYYYPGLLTVDIYRRQGINPWSKDQGIPLPIVRVNTNTGLTKQHTMFSVHDSNKVDDQKESFSQLASPEALTNLKDSMDEFREYGLTPEQISEFTQSPEVSTKTYDKLVNFLKKLNPNFKIEVLSDLSDNGIAYINDFVIQLNEGAKFRAMPEEVAHFFVEFLPLDSPLRKELLDNITNFAIYSLTLKQYKNNPLYQKNGSVNYDKIKREAAAKLIAEYVYAIAEGDISRVEELTKVKQGWLARFWERLVNFFRIGKRAQDNNRLNSYREAAKAILEEDVSYTTDYMRVRDPKNSIFLSIKESDRLRISKGILENLESLGKVEEFQSLIDDFRKDLASTFLDVVTKKGYTSIKKELQKDHNGLDTDINYLSELYDVLKNIDITEKKLDSMLTAQNQVTNLAAFIGFIVDMEKLATVLNKTVDLYDSSDYLNNAAELQSYRELYDTFIGLVNNELMDVITGTDLSDDLKKSVSNSVALFRIVDGKIVNKLRQNYIGWWKTTIGPQNKKIIDTYTQDLERTIKPSLNGNDILARQVSQTLKEYGEDLQGTMTKLEARKKLVTALSALKVPNSILKGPVIAEIIEKLEKLYTTNKAIADLMHGVGRDIDSLSDFSHFVTAGIKNHDVFISNISKFIVDKRSAAQNAATIAIRGLQNRVDPVLKVLKDLGLDEYQTGNAITYIDEVEDLSRNKKGEMNYEDGRRKIVKLLNPHSNDVYLERDRLFAAKNDALRAYNEDIHAPNAKELKDKYKQARKEYMDHLDTYWNSPFTKELRDFQSKWNNDEEFLDIKGRWDELSDEIRMKEDAYENEKDNTKFYDELVTLRKERAKLLSEKDKTGQDLKQTQLLKQYFEESRGFRVDDTRKTARNYNLARNNYEAKVDYALAEFINSGATDLDTLDRTLKAILKNNTINVKYRYRFVAQDQNADFESGVGKISLSEDSVSSDQEIATVKIILMQDFDTKNNVKVKNQAYFDYIKELYDAIEELKGRKELSVLDKRISDMYKEITDILLDRKDTFGQKNPRYLTPDERQRIEDLEDTIATIKTFNVRTYGITDEMRKKTSNRPYLGLLDAYEKKVQRYTELTSDPVKLAGNIAEVEELKRSINEANKTFEVFGVIGRDQKKTSDQIRKLYDELGSLTDRNATQAYWDRIEEILPLFESLLKVKQENLQNPTKPLSVTQSQYLSIEILNLNNLIDAISQAVFENDSQLLDLIINDEYFIETDKGDIPVLFSQYMYRSDVDTSAIQNLAESGLSEEELNDTEKNFYEWFIQSHREGKVYKPNIDPETGSNLNTGEYVDREFIRRLYYVHTEPTRPEHYENKVAKKYRATKIDDKFRQEKISWDTVDAQGNRYDKEDWTVNNKAGRPDFLPLSRKQLAAEGKTDTKYLNKEYYRMKDSRDPKDVALMQYLNISLDHYLQEQSTKPDNIRGMYNLPVTNLDSYQRLKASATNIPDRVKRLAQSIKGIFVRSEATDSEDQLDGIDQKIDVDEATQEIMTKKAPRLGMNTKLPVERVNRNVLHALTIYTANSKDFDARADLNPFIKGLTEVMRVNEASKKTSNQKNRAKLFNRIYEQMILEEQPDNITNGRFFRKTANTLMKFTGMKLTADVLGGGINYIQANINNLIEAFAYKHITPSNYGTGYVKASQMMAEMFVDYNKKSNYSFWTLMYQNFDFVQGEWLDDLSERSASKNKLFDWHRHLMLPRKNGELHAQSAMAIGILDHTRVKNTIDGKEYPMWSIYKKEGDKLALKDGFDPALYNPVDGTEYMRVKNLIWSVNIDLHGNYAKINQTDASRYALGKLMENMKRWFVAGFQRRFGRESFDVNQQVIGGGYYVTSAKAIWSLLKNIVTANMPGLKGQWNYYWNTPRNRENIYRTAADFTSILLLFLLYAVAFGYDDDDPDKNKKLRENSWLKNEALLLFLRSHAEQSAFIPVPPLGFTEMSRNLLDPLSVGKNTFMNLTGSAALTVFTVGYYLGIDQLEDDVFYQRDTGAGKGHTLFNLDVPGTKGDLKLIKYLANSIGYTGAQIDPANYLKNYQQLQNRLK